MSAVLRGLTWEHERGFGSVVAAAQAYRSVAPDVEVRWEKRSLQSFADQPLEKLVEVYDLLVIDHPHIPGAAESGILSRLDGTGHDDALTTLARQSVGASHASYAHDGGQWALATDAAAQVAAYRPDLLSEPPRDWPAVLDLAARGRVLWPFTPVDAFSSLVTVAAGNGEEPMRTPGVFLGADALAEAFGTLQRLARLVPSACAGWNPIAAADALSTGDRFAYVPLLFGYTNYSRAGFRPHRLAYVDIPASRRGVAGSLLGGAGIAVSAKTRHPEAAVAHAFWLASAEVQEGVYYDGGGQPGNDVAWRSERTNADCLDFFRNTRATLEGAYVRPRATGYVELQNALSLVIHRALIEELSVADLQKSLDAGAERWLEAS